MNPNIDSMFKQHILFFPGEEHFFLKKTGSLLSIYDTFKCLNFHRMICQQLKVQSFARMSAVVMREMVEDVMNEQCHEVAVSARKDIVKQKKAVLWKKAEIVRRRRLKRCFQRYR